MRIKRLNKRFFKRERAVFAHITTGKRYTVRWQFPVRYGWRGIKKASKRFRHGLSGGFAAIWERTSKSSVAVIDSIHAPRTAFRRQSWLSCKARIMRTPSEKRFPWAVTRIPWLVSREESPKRIMVLFPIISAGSATQGLIRVCGRFLGHSVQSIDIHDKNGRRSSFGHVSKKGYD